MGVLEQNKRNRISLGQENNALTWLIILNGVVFVLINFTKIIYYLSEIPIEHFYTQILNQVTLPADAHGFLTRPWTILTYMFTHESVWQLVASLLWLWGFGYILQDLTGNNKLVPVYLYGGLAGGIVFLLSANLIPAYRDNLGMLIPLIGAGASVMAVAVATTTLSPGYRIFPMINGGIPLWVLTLLFAVIDYATISKSNAPVALAHLAGGAAGYLFIQQLRSGRDWSGWMFRFGSWLNNLFNPDKQQAGRFTPEKHFYKATRKPFEKKPHLTQQRLDQILDKINQKGYHFLTDDEKDFLKKASQEDL